MSNRSNYNHLASHKPGCRCNACKGKTQALLGADRGDDRSATSAVVLEKPTPPKSTKDARGDSLDADGFGVIHFTDMHSNRARVLQWIELRSQGLTNAEIAPIIGITHGSLRMILLRASREGWLKYNDPRERFQNEIVPKVVDNIQHFIDAKDRTMTIEAAKGAGIFQSHQAIKVEGDAPQTVLALKIETVEGGETKVLTGHVVGKAREIEE